MMRLVWSVGVALMLASVVLVGLDVKVLGSGWIWAGTFCAGEALRIIGRNP